MTAPAENVNLRVLLELAVPLHIHEIRHWSTQNWIHQAQHCADEVASKGDILQFRSKTKGETAKAFNSLAQGLAILAYQPGGVTFAGLHWCADLHPGGSRDVDSYTCTRTLGNSGACGEPPAPTTRAPRPTVTIDIPGGQL